MQFKFSFMIQPKLYYFYAFNAKLSGTYLQLEIFDSIRDNVQKLEIARP